MVCFGLYAQERIGMPPITQGHKQFIVNINTLLGWRKLLKVYPHATIQDKVGDTLFVSADSSTFTITGREVTRTDNLGNIT
jgi:hypothetical protein